MAISLYKKFLKIQFVHTGLPGYDAADPAAVNLDLFTIEPTKKTAELLKNLRFQFRQGKGYAELFYSGKAVSNNSEPLPAIPEGYVFSFSIKLTNTQFLDDSGAIANFEPLNNNGIIRYYYCLTTANPVTVKYGAFNSGSLKTHPSSGTPPLDYKYLQLNRPNTGMTSSDIQLPVFNRGLTLTFTEPGDLGFTGYNNTEKFQLIDSKGAVAFEDYFNKVTDDGGTNPRIEINGLSIDRLPAGVYQAKLVKAFVPAVLVYINTDRDADGAYAIMDVELKAPVQFNKALPIGTNPNNSVWYNLLYYTFS